MRSVVRNPILAAVVVAIGIALAAGGIYVGETDDAPGAALIGIVLLLGAVGLAAKIIRTGRFVS